MEFAFWRRRIVILEYLPSLSDESSWWKIQYFLITKFGLELLRLFGPDLLRSLTRSLWKTRQVQTSESRHRAALTLFQNEIYIWLKCWRFFQIFLLQFDFYFLALISYCSRSVTKISYRVKAYHYMEHCSLGWSKVLAITL